MNSSEASIVFRGSPNPIAKISPVWEDVAKAVLGDIDSSERTCFYLINGMVEIYDLLHDRGRVLHNGGKSVAARVDQLRKLGYNVGHFPVRGFGQGNFKEFIAYARRTTA